MVAAERLRALRVRRDPLHAEPEPLALTNCGGMPNVWQCRAVLYAARRNVTTCVFQIAALHRANPACSMWKPKVFAPGAAHAFSSSCITIQRMVRGSRRPLEWTA